MKLEHFLIPYTKINSKLIKHLNIRPETTKLLEENIGITLYDIHHRKILHDPPPTIMEIKTKINKWDLIKLKSFCTAKENIHRMKRQPSEWEKVFANEAMDKGLISKILKQLMELNIKKTNPIKKWMEVLSRQLFKVLSFKGVTWLLYAEETVEGKEKIGKILSSRQEMINLEK